MSKAPRRLADAIEAWELENGRKLSQHDLTAMTGVSQPVLSKLSNGTNLKGVAASTIVRICEALNCEVGWFLTGAGAQPRRIPRFRVPEAESTTQDAVVELHQPLTQPPADPKHPPIDEQASRQ
jgi:DNA-binding Xre family transcriptional regulator